MHCRTWLLYQEKTACQKGIIDSFLVFSMAMVPLRVELDVDGYRLSECLVWHDTGILLPDPALDAFIQHLIVDYDLPDVVNTALTDSLVEQIDDFRRCHLSGFLSDYLIHHSFLVIVRLLHLYLVGYNY